MITFIKIFDETSNRTRYINPEYITDLELFKYMGEDHVSILPAGTAQHLSTPKEINHERQTANTF